MDDNDVAGRMFPSMKTEGGAASQPGSIGTPWSQQKQMQTPAETRDERLAKAIFKGPPEKVDVFAKDRAEREQRAQQRERAERQRTRDPAPDQNQERPQQAKVVEDAATLSGALEQAGLGLSSEHEETKAFSKLAADMGLSSENAVKLAKFDQQRNEQIWNKQFEAWDAAVRDEFTSADIEDARAVVAKYGDSELQELLTGWGLGSHPALVRFARNIARRHDR